MWIILIIIVAVIVIWAISSKNSDDEKVREYYNNSGGFKSNFPNFINILENDFGMILKYDDGRKFCYKKNDNSGELNIGLKLEMNNVRVMFSEFTKNGHTQKGTNVTFHSDTDNELLTRSVKKSIENLHTSLHIEISQKKHSKEWKEFISNSENEDFIFEHVDQLFVFDDINPKKFLTNLHYKKVGFNLENEQTPSMNEILYSPPAFTDFFIAGYPDVYLWSQKNHSTVDAYKNLENEEEDYFNYIENLLLMYRSMINQYKKEGNKLECK
jgi:hypothetical protein